MKSNPKIKESINDSLKFEVNSVVNKKATNRKK